MGGVADREAALGVDYRGPNTSPRAAFGSFFVVEKADLLLLYCTLLDFLAVVNIVGIVARAGHRGCWAEEYAKTGQKGGDPGGEYRFRANPAH